MFAQQPACRLGDQKTSKLLLHSCHPRAWSRLLVSVKFRAATDLLLMFVDHNVAPLESFNTKSFFWRKLESRINANRILWVSRTYYFWTFRVRNIDIVVVRKRENGKEMTVAGLITEEATTTSTVIIIGEFTYEVWFSQMIHHRISQTQAHPKKKKENCKYNCKVHSIKNKKVSALII